MRRKRCVRVFIHARTTIGSAHNKAKVDLARRAAISRPAAVKLAGRPRLASAFVALLRGAPAGAEVTCARVAAAAAAAIERRVNESRPPSGCAGACVFT